MTLFAITFLAPPPRGVAALVSVTDDKIQLTILILGRVALSSCYHLDACVYMKSNKTKVNLTCFPLAVGSRIASHMNVWPYFSIVFVFHLPTPTCFTNCQFGTQYGHNKTREKTKRFLNRIKCKYNKR